MVIRFAYHTFADKTPKEIVFHLYLLKQYNNRWFLIGAADEDGKMLNFALDRIDRVTPLPGQKFKPCQEDLAERFEDIIGVTLYENRPIEHILFWVSNHSKDYVETKPIHGSQRRHGAEREAEIRHRYPTLHERAFFTIDCIPNYELIRELCSFGNHLFVLSPSSFQDEIFAHIKAMFDDYSDVRT